MGLLLPVKPQFRATLECLHMPPNASPLCTTCVSIRSVGWETHWKLMTTDTKYGSLFIKRMRLELFFLHTLPFMPWLDLLMSAMFIVNVCFAYDYAAAIIAHEPGARAHAWPMIRNAGAAVNLYLSQRYYRKAFF